MSKISRRHFFFGTMLAGVVPRAGFGSVASLKALGYQSPNEKLNIAGIGAGGQALGDLRQHSAENIVALADVDWARGAQGFQAFPKAAKYKDFRQMLDKDGKQIDAVVIGTPDHTHATCAIACMQLGKGVYVEKPLTRTPWEARLLADAARKYKVATQMGNQGYSHEATRVAAEIIWSGEIGAVTEVHAFRGPTSWPTGAAMQQTPSPTPVPDTLDWDLWLGPAAMRPFTRGGDTYEQAQNGFYLPFNWRGFHDFGTGLIGDWAIHIFGPANLALRLGSPTSVECVKQDGISPFTFADRQHIRWEFPARAGMPPVTLNWYVNYPGPASADAYTPPGMTAEEARQIPGSGPTIAAAAGRAAGAGRAGAPAVTRQRPDAAARRPLKPPRRRAVEAAAAAVVGRAFRRAATTRSSSAPKAIWVRAAAAKALAFCRDRGGRTTRCLPRCSRVRRVITVTGSGRARAASRRVRTSASQGRTPSGSCSARSPRVFPASSCGTRPSSSSPTTAMPTVMCGRCSERGGKSSRL